MLRITREADYGIVLLIRFARATAGALHNARDLAEECRLPFPMVSKVLKLLAKEGLLESQRGAKGGYCLARPPERISVAEVVAALQGPIALTACTTLGAGDCEREGICPAMPHWQRINHRIQQVLEQFSLAEMAQAPRPEAAEAAFPVEETLFRVGVS